MTARKPRGIFITLEGGEGAGKSTQLQRLATRFRGLGREVIVTREPGGSPGAERIREVLLDPKSAGFDGVTQALLFAAARRDHVTTLIRPALKSGAVVLCDRFADSTRAYQGAAGAVPLTLIDRLERLAVGPTRPDLTIILDLDPALGMARAHERRGAPLSGSDAFERQALDFHHKVREGFLAIAAREPQRCHVVNANVHMDQVETSIWNLVQNHRFA